MAKISEDILDEVNAAALQLVEDNFATLQIGSDGTPASESDNGVITFIADTTPTVDSVSTPGSITGSAIFGITVGIGQTIREVAVVNGVKGVLRGNTTPFLNTGDTIVWVDATVTSTARNLN